MRFGFFHLQFNEGCWFPCTLGAVAGVKHGVMLRPYVFTRPSSSFVTLLLSLCQDFRTCVRRCAHVAAFLLVCKIHVREEVTGQDVLRVVCRDRRVVGRQCVSSVMGTELDVSFTLFVRQWHLAVLVRRFHWIELMPANINLDCDIWDM